MEKIEKLRNILIDKIKNKEITQTAIAKDTGIDQASINRFYKETKGLSAENIIKLFKYFGLGDGKDEEQIGKENIISRIRDLEARIADQSERLADKNEIIALQREKIAEQKEKIAALEREVPVYADIREKLEALRKNQEMFARVHMLAKLATREGQTLADEIGLKQEAFVKNMDSDEKLDFWRSLGERLVQLANFPHIPIDVAINLEKYLVAFRDKSVETSGAANGSSDSGGQVA